MSQCHTAFVLLGVEVEKGVERHELDAGARIDVLLRHLLGEIALHGTVGVGIAIAVRKPQQLSIFAEEGEVTPPGVDADAPEFDAFGLHLA